MLAEGLRLNDVTLPEGKSGKVLPDSATITALLRSGLLLMGVRHLTSRYPIYGSPFPTRETDNIGFIINADSVSM